MGGKSDPRRLKEPEELLATIAIGEEVIAKWLPTADLAADRAHWKWLKETLPSCTTKQVQQLTNEFSVQWNEGAGPEVEEFWSQVKSAALGFTRKRDIVKSALEAGRIVNEHVYVEIDRNFERIQECGKINGEQAAESVNENETQRTRY